MAILLASFGLIFLAELPDKTLYAVLVLATRGRALPVLLGACAAFLVHGFIAVGLGELFGQLPAGVVRCGTAALFLAFGLLLLLRREKDDSAGAPASTTHLFLGTFGIVFAAEWGDATQLGTAALVARAPPQRWLVFAGATLALWTGALLAVTVGQLLGDRMPRLLVRRIAGALFCAFGVVSALHSW